MSASSAGPRHSRRPSSTFARLGAWLVVAWLACAAGAHAQTRADAAPAPTSASAASASTPGNTPAAAPLDSPAACPPPAATPTAEQVQAGMKAARDHGFLWRIRKAGRVSYLYGTVHVARPEWMYPGPRVLAAIRATDVTALELDPLDPDIQRRLRDGMAAQRKVTLPAPLELRLREQMRAQCTSPEALAGMGPEMQIAALSVMVARADGLEAAYGIDFFLAGLAHGAKREVISLETPELQLNALQMPDAEGTLAAVESGLDDLESGHARPLLNRIAQVWADGDMEQLARYGDWCGCLDTPIERDAMKRLLDQRNPGLADAIDALHAGGRKVFAAVGSLHMFGQYGLPKLMVERGYQVERVPFAPARAPR